jgi:hypothetical protein
MDDFRDDLIGPGLAKIAAATNESTRRVRYLIRHHSLPCFERGGRVYSRRSWLDRYFRGEDVTDAPSRPPPVSGSKPEPPLGKMLATPDGMVERGSCVYCKEPILVPAGRRGRPPSAHAECRKAAEREGKADG